VFYAGADPVAQGFVTSLNRPGGNATGVSFFATALGGNGSGCCASCCRKPRR